jgi:hypothetical protein
MHQPNLLVDLMNAMNVCQVPNYILSINILKLKKNNNNNKINIFITYVGLVFVNPVDDHRFDRREQ